jgi:hypothetical protein
MVSAMNRSDIDESHCMYACMYSIIAICLKNNFGSINKLV